jgi:hypothetical protein
MYNVRLIVCYYYRGVSSQLILAFWNDKLKWYDFSSAARVKFRGVRGLGVRRGRDRRKSRGKILHRIHLIVEEIGELFILELTRHSPGTGLSRD